MECCIHIDRQGITAIGLKSTESLTLLWVKQAKPVEVYQINS